MMEPIQYLHLQLRLEGKEIVNECFLREVEVVPDEELPLMLIAQLADGTRVAYYEETISPDLQAMLETGMVDIEFPDINPLLEVLKKQNLQFEVGHFKTYSFPSIPVYERDVQFLSRDDPKIKAFGFYGFAEQVYGIERDGNIVSACVSTRENENCGEAWVYTALNYRHQGLAQKVVSAWAESLLITGKVPFYSHKIDNAASAKLAKSLQLQPLFEEIVVTRA